MSTRPALLGAALGALIWAAALLVLWGELPTGPASMIAVEASGVHAGQIDSAVVILDHPEYPTDARVVVWIDGVPASCISTDQGARGWVEVHPEGFAHAPVHGGWFLPDPECGVVVTLPGGEVDAERIELRFAGVLG